MKASARRIQWLIDFLILALGAYFGVQLSAIGEFEVFKLLNIVGLAFDILGVLLLSYVLSTSARFKEFIAGWGAATTIGILGFMPGGLFLGAVLGGHALGHAEVDHLFTIFVPVVVYSMLSVFFIEDTVLLPKFKRFRSNETRIKVLGGFFLLSGLGIQLYAAVLDLLG